MLSDFISVPPERSEAMKCVERMRRRVSSFDLIFDSSMEICDRYGIIGPVGETKADADCA